MTTFGVVFVRVPLCRVVVVAGSRFQHGERVYIVDWWYAPNGYYKHSCQGTYNPLLKIFYEIVQLFQREHLHAFVKSNLNYYYLHQ